MRRCCASVPSESALCSNKLPQKLFILAIYGTQAVMAPDIGQSTLLVRPPSCALLVSPFSPVFDLELECRRAGASSAGFPRCSSEQAFRADEGGAPSLMQQVLGLCRPSSPVAAQVRRNIAEHGHEQCMRLARSAAAYSMCPPPLAIHTHTNPMCAPPTATPAASATAHAAARCIRDQWRRQWRCCSWRKPAAA